MARVRKRGGARKQIGVMSVNPAKSSPKRTSKVLKPPDVFSEALRAVVDRLPEDAGGYLRQDPRSVAREQRNREAPFGIQYFRDLMRDLHDHMFESGLGQLLLATYYLASRREPFTREELEKWWTARRGGMGRDPMELSLVFSTYDRARRIRRSAGAARGPRGHRRPEQVK
jgi:hypothetical protein